MSCDNTLLRRRVLCLTETAACLPAAPQAELLLDLRLCPDPNSMFYCGDTCQTIARGELCRLHRR